MAKLLDIDYLTLRGGTSEEWEKVNPVLHNKEPGLEYCKDGSIKLKAGDGSTAWKSLPYIGGGKEESEAKGDTIFAGPIVKNSPKLWLKGEQLDATGTGITVSFDEPGAKTMLWIKGVQ